jgi:hypothetical protein
VLTDGGELGLGGRYLLVSIWGVAIRWTDVHEMVISSPGAIGRVAWTVCERRDGSMTYCALLDI